MVSLLSIVQASKWGGGQCNIHFTSPVLPPSLKVLVPDPIIQAAYLKIIESWRMESNIMNTKGKSSFYKGRTKVQLKAKEFISAYLGKGESKGISLTLNLEAIVTISTNT